MSDNGYASREALLGLKGQRRHRDVDLPICGMRVKVQSLTERELSEYQGAVLTSSRGQQFNRARLLDANRRLIALCLVDGSGKRLLTPTDMPALAEWDAADTQVLYDACASHCGINRDDIEELAKNSPPTPAA